MTGMASQPRRSSRRTERRSAHDRFHWSEETVALLGTMPDNVLAAKLGLYPDSVSRERRQRGIPGFKPRRKIEWTQEMIAMLGTRSDAEVGAALGIPGSAVRNRRIALGIAPHLTLARGGPHLHFWTPAEIGLLGRVTDQEVADLVGLSCSTVTRKRQSLRIRPLRPSAAIRWTQEMISLLGKLPDREVAARFGISARSVAMKRRSLAIPPRGRRRRLRGGSAVR